MPRSQSPRLLLTVIVHCYIKLELNISEGLDCERTSICAAIHIINLWI